MVGGSIRHLRTELSVLAVLLLALHGCGARPTPNAPESGGSFAPSHRSSTSLCISVQDGIVMDLQFVVWRARNPNDEAAIEQDHGLETVGSVLGYRMSLGGPGTYASSLVQALRSDPRVETAEPNFVTDTPEALGHTWAFDDGVLDAGGYEDPSTATRLGLSSAHEISRGDGVLIAVLDTGVNEGHPLLAGHVVQGYDFVDDDLDASETPDGRDSDGDGIVDEAVGHGTHVAGIIAHVAPGASILPVRVLDSDGRGSLFSIARGIVYAISRGARVINLSLGLLTDSDLLNLVIQDAASRGVVVIASAGNWGAEEPREYPAASGNVIAVAATDSSDAPASFTSFGGFVNVCAPGAGIRSSYWNGNTAVWSGTSMSAGFVSGGAALIVAVHPEWRQSEVRSLLSETAAPLSPSGSGSYASLTAGRIDLGAALAPSSSASSPPPDPPPTSEAP